jgi:hypothetical protein
MVIYVEGDVILNEIVRFNPGTKHSLDEISAVYIIARNIYIAPGAQQIDAVLIAQPDASGNGGEIYTCSNGFGPPTNVQLNSSGATGCRKPLVINGAVIAKTIRLLRTNGTVSNSLNSEPTPIVSGIPAVNSLSGLAAEHFIYSPETWLVAPPGFPPPSSRFDAYTAMPPIL